MDALSQLAEKHKTDKGLWHHAYTLVYSRYFERLRNEPIKLLEIGIGGYHHVSKGGESLRMWGEYFANGTIVGVDVYRKQLQGLPPNVRVMQGSQIDAMFLNYLPRDFDIIIDDGSHVNDHVVYTFKYLFPRMKSGAIYVVEDTETSYWALEYGGGEHDGTTMNYFKKLTDMLNPESGRENFYGIESIHFYKGLIFIFKQ